MSSKKQASPDWLKKRELSYRRTGKLNLAGITIKDFSAIKSRKSLRELNITRCKVTSLQGLHVQPNIETFIAEGSGLNSFNNFLSIANASVYNLINTPLSKKPNYILALTILSPDIRIVDGKLVSETIKRKARAYPSCARDLLSAGWELIYPCPDDEHMAELCDHYQINNNDDFEREIDEIHTHIDAAANLEDENEEYPQQPVDYLELIEQFMDQHDEIINEAAKSFYLVDDKNEAFATKLRDLLETRNFEFQEEQDIEQQIVDAIRLICIKRNEH